MTLNANATTYTVTTLKNAGPGSFRAAILAARGGSGNTIAFATAGTINLSSSLPLINSPMTIDGTTAPGFSSSPVVSINFSGNTGLTIAKGAPGTVIKALSLVNASSDALTIGAPGCVIEGNYIGLTTGGVVAANSGDGIKILSMSSGNLIGSNDPVSSISYYNTSDTTKFTVQPVTAWQGLRNYGSHEGQFLICGSSDANGLLYVGPLSGGGTSYTVQYPGSTITSTSVYGPDNLNGGQLRLVGSYRNSSDTTIYNHGFLWQGTTSQLPSGGTFLSIDYPNAKYQYTHSTMEDLAVGNADGPSLGGGQPAPGSGVAYIYNVRTHAFVTNIVYPGSKTTTAYGIWYNGKNKYTICGGYSPVVTNNLKHQDRPLTQGRAYLVDYDAKSGAFSNWATFDYPNGPVGVNFITHFEGISSSEPGVYTLCADSLQTGTSFEQGSWVSVRRKADSSFGLGLWVDLNYPSTAPGILSANSVYGYNVVGIVAGSPTFSFQSTINIGFQLSNVISGNLGNGISLNGSNANTVAMNYIGTDIHGSTNPAFGNALNGILITGGATGNLIGGQATGLNNPTGTKGTVTPVFQRPPQGNLISGNHANGVLINGGSIQNVLSGNFIGTDFTGTNVLGNRLDGVDVESANDTSFIGCTLYQNPFVFYNVIGGNGGNGIRVNNSNNVTIQANFVGMGSDNTALVPNAGDGVLICGSSANTQIGGVIPLGNVISGNTENGIEVVDTANGFISFNTFGGIPAFKVVAAPNGQDGILITSTGGNNTIRTCIISGNNGNGIEIGGNASGVQITDTSVGTTTDINGSIPNQYNGIVLSGTAHGNAIGGFQPSVEPTVYASGNVGYGIAILDRAHDNVIFGSNVGIGALSNIIPNQQGGIYLDSGTSGTTIGGVATKFQDTIEYNGGDGLTILSSKNNTVIDDTIRFNVTGIYANGACNGTTISGNTVTSNTAVNVDISSATGISYTP